MEAENSAGRRADETRSTDSAYRTIMFRLNGTEQRFSTRPNTPMLDLLREQAGLTGAKRGCEMGNCGACTISLDGESVYSCLLLASECHGRDVRTVEGLADEDDLHPLQQAFIDCDAFQCGYCTPGQLMSLSCLFDKDPCPDEDAVVEATSGNLCRCGAYRHIRDAAMQVAGDNAEPVDGD